MDFGLPIEILITKKRTLQTRTFLTGRKNGTTVHTNKEHSNELMNLTSDRITSTTVRCGELSLNFLNKRNLLGEVFPSLYHLLTRI